MPNIAAVLKEEIARLARKEIRSETESLRKAVAHYRGDIATLKREIADLQRQLNRVARQAGRAIRQPEPDSSHRFSAKGLASHRERLGLSAEQFAALVGVTAQSIYKWESGKARPRASQLPAIAEIRKIGRRDAAKRLAELDT